MVAGVGYDPTNGWLIEASALPLGYPAIYTRPINYYHKIATFSSKNCCKGL